MPDIQQQMLVELRRIASVSGGGSRQIQYVNLNKALNVETAKQIGIIKEQQKWHHQLGAGIKSNITNMAAQALIMGPINALLGGFFEVFEPITDVLGDIGAAFGQSLAPIVKDVASILAQAVPFLTELARGAAALWETFKGLASGAALVQNGLMSLSAPIQALLGVLPRGGGGNPPPESYSYSPPGESLIEPPGGPGGWNRRIIL
jgi:hypothetical protein